MANVIGRRSFLGSVGGAAALAAVTGCASKATTPVAAAAPAAQPAMQPAPGAPMAAAPSPMTQLIAKYPPLAPLGDEVFQRRFARVRELAKEAGASCVFATSGTTAFAYLAGSRVERSERLIALVVPVDHDEFLVAPAFEVERMKRQTRLRDVRPWEEQDNPFAVVAKGVSAAKGPHKILVEPHTEYQAAIALGRALPGAKLLDGAPAFERLRLHKDQDELARIRRAIEVTQDIWDLAFAELRPGVKDREVAQAITEKFRQVGYTGYGLVQFGALASLPHGHPNGAPLTEGSVVLIDGGCEVDGYWSDITRTRVFGGGGPDEFAKVHAIVHDAQSAAIERARPGVACQEIDRAARAVIDKAGYGQFFTHRLGHGLGMDGHEPAYMVEGNTQKLEPGFVFTAEPGIYLPGKFGVRIEDDVLCGPDGAVVLSKRTAR
ncbi:MAG TPA: Xaa-Pro peptidase family protein [Kofleriaceae bacterium]|nr:Xaa-Pro peptidase family protein [Kofleriaceae bacterium]